MRSREIRRDGANDHEQHGLTEFRVRVNLPSLIGQVWVPIQCVFTLITGFSNPIRQVVPQKSHFRSYPQHCFRLHPPSLSVTSITLPSSQTTKSSHSSLSLHVMIMSWQWEQHTPSTAYTEYSIHWVQHTPSTVFTEYSLHHVQRTLSAASSQDMLSSLHSQYYKLTSECSFSFRCASLFDRPPSNQLSIRPQM